MTRVLAIAAVLLAASCERAPTAEQKALAVARDIERVEAAQKTTPPLTALAPEPITFADIEKNRLFGASCIFLPEGAKTHLVLAMSNTAYLKVGGELRVYAADKGSAPLPLGAWTRYEGREHVIDLQTAGGDGTPAGEETTDWPGHLTIRDPYSRVLYSAAGTVRCGV
jgi:hypothetical protein